RKACTRAVVQRDKQQTTVDRNKMNAERDQNSMKTLAIVPSISEAMLLAGLAFRQATLPVPAPSPNAGMEELTGVVSDAICKGMHFCKAVTPFGCTLECVQEGANWSWAL